MAVGFIWVYKSNEKMVKIKNLLCIGKMNLDRGDPARMMK
jgi:hypothetical protein